jgi:hypothetical protein
MGRRTGRAFNLDSAPVGLLFGARRLRRNNTLKGGAR